MRIRFLTLAALALLVSAPAFAQIPAGWYTDDPIPGPQLASPSTPDPSYPLRVRLHLRANYWHGKDEYYAGHGRMQLTSAGPATSMYFEYECGVSFLNPGINEFQARWIKSNKTLQILLTDPDHPSKPRTCKVNAIEKPNPRVPWWVAVPVNPAR